jgi:hypothetical protein
VDVSVTVAGEDGCEPAGEGAAVTAEVLINATEPRAAPPTSNPESLMNSRLEIPLDSFSPELITFFSFFILYSFLCPLRPLISNLTLRTKIHMRV